MLSLQDFISETLQEILTGVQKAQQETGPGDIAINPFVYGAEGVDGIPHEKTHVGGEDAIRFLQDVEFDVAVTVEDVKGSDGKASISVLGASVGIGGLIKNRKNSIHRITFKVPIKLPVQVPPTYHYQPPEILNFVLPRKPK